MENKLLSRGNGFYCSFKNFACPHGITTCKYNDDLKNRGVMLIGMKDREIMNRVRANKIIRLVPQHENNVIIANGRLHQVINRFKVDGAIHICDPRENRQKPVIISTAADCPTVLFTDTHCSFIAAAHSGWRGTAKNIVSKVIFSLTDACRNETKPIRTENIKAAIIGGICGGCYRINDDVARYFPGYISKKHLSLKTVIADQLTQCGVLRKNILITAQCSLHSTDTDGRPLLSSYRRSKTLGQKHTDFDYVFIAYPD